MAEKLEAVHANEVKVYTGIVEFMKKDATEQQIYRLDILKALIIRGNFSPSSASIMIFGLNLFVFSYEKYVEMYNTILEDAEKEMEASSNVARTQ